MSDITNLCKEKNIKAPKDLANTALNRRLYLKPSNTTEARVDLFNILSILDQNDGIMYLEELIKIDQKPWSGDPGEINLIELIKLAENKLIELKKSEDKFSQKQRESKINPIYWKKDCEILKQFLNNLKSVGLIESRDTDDIIKEHFYVDGQKPNKESQPIKWGIKKTDRLLMYFVYKVGNIGFIEYDSMWEIIRSHFAKSNGEPFKISQLQTDWSNTGGYNYKPRGHKKVDEILGSIKN